jgi:hypothetical protein
MGSSADTVLEQDTFLKEQVFRPVAERVKDRSDSLFGIARFPASGIEGWLKVEAVRALEHRVEKLQNIGPDLLLVDNIFIELKGATNCSAPWYLSGLMRYQAQYPRLACLFIGSGRKSSISACFKKLKRRSRVVANEQFSVGTDEWIVGLIVPENSPPTAND